MSILSDLARWAAQLDPSAVPPDLRQRALLQHLSCAGALRLSLGTDVRAPLLAGSASRGKVKAVGLGKKLARADALRLYAGGIAAWDYADTLLWASTGPGSVGAAWALADQHSLDQVLCATIAANEVSARLGASALFAPASGLAWGSVQALASATVAGRLADLDADTMARAYSLALAMAGDASMSDLARSAHARAAASAAAVQAGVQAVELARAGARGNLDALESDEWYAARGCPLPLRPAFGGLGRCWLTRSIAFKTSPVTLHHAVAFQALQEVLNRHIIAAEKRLRPDQWTEAVVRVPWSTWYAEQIGGSGRHGMSWSLKSLLAVYGVSHELGATELGQDFWDERGSQIQEQASKIRIEHAWDHSVEALVALVEGAAPLLGGLTLGQLKQVGGYLRASTPHPGAPGRHELLAMAKARPDRLVALLSKSGSMDDWDPETWRYTLPMDIKIHTTRGGFWPEVRGYMECAPGWSWDDTLDRVQAKFAAGDEARAGQATQLLLAEGSALATDWIAGL
jgi:hypothetical protein